MTRRATLCLLIGCCCALLAGCSGSSVVPGLGGSDGLGTPGAGTGNPDATLYYFISGMDTPNFIANEVSVRETLLGLQIRANQTLGHDKREVTRVTSILFNGPLAEGKSYLVGDYSADGVNISLSSKPVKGSLSVWDGSAGTLVVDKITDTHIEGRLNAVLSPSMNSTVTLEASGGRFRVKLP
ncbi:MAG: hypothetical protein GYA63_04430 [Armatimonadetes bacterium]|jgi:hypothetical protein|nr:hypothetical protein [Armatimonadota bacterium]